MALLKVFGPTMATIERVNKGQMSGRMVNHEGTGMLSVKPVSTCPTVGGSRGLRMYGRRL